MDAELETQLAGHAGELQLLGAELDRQRASYSSRMSASNSRAAILIGAASIGAGFQLDASTSSWLIASVSMTILAALCGLVAMWPRRGDELNIGPMVDVMYNFGPRTTEWNLLKHKLHVHNLDEVALRRRRRWVLAGFSFLALSVAFTGLRVAGIPSPQFTHSSPAPTSTSAYGEVK
ncbi:MULTISPECIES: hypothetical protein [unclassified Cryobacterium]|uniref:hypothetical protein n=1 Tax=unclassified Cryobacterium TaxID=2649013 RepID=UPI001068F91F|nr:MULTISPECIES: hypothetical protein [unclassified Cryobacterium]TFB96269.1 hypothetical protein E3O39_09185 [Cryobacterium sp. MDB2-A-1]TFC12554.1 hypothetical protein E3O35_06350 [Cryobacterium sp. MDB2-A-2]